MMSYDGKSGRQCPTGPVSYGASVLPGQRPSACQTLMALAEDPSRKTFLRKMPVRDLALSLLLVSSSLLSGPGHDLWCLDERRSLPCLTPERVEVDDPCVSSGAKSPIVGSNEGKEPCCPGCQLSGQRVCFRRILSIRCPVLATQAPAIPETCFHTLQPRSHRTSRGPPAA